MYEYFFEERLEFEWYWDFQGKQKLEAQQYLDGTFTQESVNARYAGVPLWGQLSVKDKPVIENMKGHRFISYYSIFW